MVSFYYIFIISWDINQRETQRAMTLVFHGQTECVIFYHSHQYQTKIMQKIMVSPYNGPSIKVGTCDDIQGTKLDGMT